MGAVVYAVPGFAEADAGGGLLIPFRQSWTGWDGTVWDLNDADAGVRLTTNLSRVVGLGMSPMERFATASPAAAGSRTRGHRMLERVVVWPLRVSGPTNTQAWIELDRAIWRTFRPGEVGTWSVTQPSNGETRTLECQFLSVQDDIDIDPAMAGRGDYVVTLVADDPYWRGPTVSRVFNASTPTSFFGAGGPPFTISESSTLATAAITNPGDVDAWPVWTIRDAMTAVTLGVGGREVGTTYDIGNGDVMVIDTDPRRQSVTVNGTRIRGILSPHDFAPIPAGGRVDLDIDLTGSGSVTCAIVPRYERAW